MAFPLSAPVWAQQQPRADAPEGGTGRALSTVTVTGGQPTSLPAQIPTTIEGVTREQIAETVNATDAEDALKYLPSLVVRKRYIGDFNHAVLATRASGTGNSARSMVYGDGIMLSNPLGNGATYAPRWGMVSPEEIERVDVLYGPFSAAYPGNSVGAVVDYVTRMPTQLEAHVKLSGFASNFDQYGSHSSPAGQQLDLSLGSRSGDWSWWLSASRTHSKGQALVFGNRLLSAGTVGNAGTPVTGAVLGLNPSNQPWWLVGGSTMYDTTQEQAKLKVAYDFSPTLRATYTLGAWNNTTHGGVDTYLRNAFGQPVYSGRVNIAGRTYNLDAPSAALAPTETALTHYMHGLSVKSHTGGVFDWEVAASLFDYSSDTSRTPTTPLPGAFNGGPGRTTDMGGSGWNTFKAAGTWRPTGSAEGVGAHVVDFGFQQDTARLRTSVGNTLDWINGSPVTPFSAFNGNTRLQSLYVQDTWRFAKDWKTTLGLRHERWEAYGGQLGNAARLLDFAPRKNSYDSPKAAVAWQATPDWLFKASTGRAVRMPTVSELYQGSIDGNRIVNTNPNLRPERSWTTELTAERDLKGWGLDGMLRTTLFFENTKDALYSQALNNLVNTVQNVDAIRTRGLEVALNAVDVGMKGFDLSGSLTLTNSKITANSGFPASVGREQPRVPKVRASLLATYRPDAKWSYTVGMRYSGKQFGSLDNSDPNGFAYMGFSKFFVVDARIRYRIDRQWSAAFGIDNLNNNKYWAFHPYPQRTYVAELKFDL
ncbi:iron complex outermembrane receptor protein [Variovorax boronicumulans]|uniref:TonB-dependent receptor n=1 Tax=Variovorax TaxID=34072 RepID=UPI00277F4225|nr:MULTISPECIES: TonB-dependent receptor [Variovorax]MDQ0037216.1 iron complex outermembrane receptor protein [Variovorax boronicumulans]MDQ0612356.1 iron complex outermembrane receptor protein [Variovorax sp. W1I1]